MDPNQPDAKAGLSGVLRAIAVLAVILVAAIGILAVLEVIPREALQEWLTKFALVGAIVVAAAVALALLMRTR
ncbi:MAG TPA: hypothetical protein VD965_05455 [Burkholderiales bacterium]|nr:hypothetical protein [Burkholderiales bacterium]